MEKKAQMLKEREAELESFSRVIKTLDDLLGCLPDEQIRMFAKTEDFKLYERLVDKYCKKE